MTFWKKGGRYIGGKIIYLPADSILPNPAQPRKHFDSAGLKELAVSIKKYGILQPLTVHRRGECYELVAGERRLRAAKLAGEKNVPCIVLEADLQDMALLALIENLHRRDLDFIEEAEGIGKLIKAYGLSQEEAARKLGKSQPAIANKLRILRLSKDVLYLIREYGLSERHARALLRLNSEEERMAAVKEIITRGLNVAQTEEYIEKLLIKKVAEPPKKAAQPMYVLKDVRLFLNTVNRGMNMMQQSGIDARCGKDETETDIILTIRIPKEQQKSALLQGI